MKKRLFSCLLALCLLCSTVSISAYAAEDQTAGSMEATYTVDYGYVVNIPAACDFSEGAAASISASKMVIGDSSMLVVAVDPSSEGIYTNGGAFALQMVDDTDPNYPSNIFCDFYRQGNGFSSENTADKLDSQHGDQYLDYGVAYFRANQTDPALYGSFYLEPNAKIGGIYAGQYHATIDFLIYTAEESDFSQLFAE